MAASSFSAVRRIFVLAALLCACAAAAAAPAAASPFATGPAPTAAELANPSGPYPIDVIRVPSSASPDFGEATIFVPRAPAGSTFAGVGISPGFLAEQWTLQWLARRIATNGFVTIVFTPNNVTIRPPERSRVLLAALEYLTTQSAARGRVDAERLAVLGHSMGGGAALEAARRKPALKAVVAIAPWAERRSFADVTTPTLVLGFWPDWIAPVTWHARPFYRTLDRTTPKGYLELNLDHAAPSLQPVTEVSRATISWLKRFVDGDARYTEALCPLPGGVKRRTITAYRSSCGSGPLAVQER